MRGDFFRGARVGPKPVKSIEHAPFTFGEAAFVMADVAHRDGISEERFIELLRRRCLRNGRA